MKNIQYTDQYHNVAKFVCGSEYVKKIIDKITEFCNSDQKIFDLTLFPYEDPDVPMHGPNLNYNPDW